MNRLSVLLCRVGLAISGLLLAAAPIRAQSPSTPIPSAQGTTLAGTAVILPDALKGKAGVLVLGFSRASQEQISNWGRLITAEYGQSPGLAYFEVPMLWGTSKMLRGMTLKNMAKSVPAAERPHFIPLVDDDKPWRTFANYDKPDDAYVFLVDANGTVRWRTQGEATDAAWGDFKGQLDGLLGSTGKR